MKPILSNVMSMVYLDLLKVTILRNTIAGILHLCIALSIGTAVVIRSTGVFLPSIVVTIIPMTEDHSGLHP